jgi:uridylate kinase
MPQSYILKLGGSTVWGPDHVHVDRIRALAETIRDSFAVTGIVVGGGIVARKYITAARAMGAGEAMCDQFGIDTSRVNARLLIAALGDRAYPEPITSLAEARIAALTNKVLVMGGLVPGQSTTSVTFELAETLGARNVLILTDVDGVYDSDPRKNLQAKKYSEITISELERVIVGAGGDRQAAAGEYRIFDAVSTQIFRRTDFEVRLLSGNKMDPLRRLLAGGGSVEAGTRIIRDSE